MDSSPHRDPEGAIDPLLLQHVDSRKFLLQKVGMNWNELSCSGLSEPWLMVGAEPLL